MILLKILTIAENKKSHSIEKHFIYYAATFCSLVVSEAHSVDDESHCFPWPFKKTLMLTPWRRTF